jgi:hypothetical protein
VALNNQVGDAISDTSDQREKEDNEVSQLHPKVDAESSQYERSEPQHIKGHKAGIAPIVSEQLRELVLEAGQIFLGEMQALHGNREQVDGKNRGGIVLPCPRGSLPHQVRSRL